RRGYAPLTLCRACGHRFQCPSCTAWLVEHRFTRRLLCHHCGHAEAVPPFCPECLAGGALVPCGPGVERLLEEVTARFPAARAARAEHKGRVLIQTWMPDQPVMQALASGDRDRFLEAEAAARRNAGLPPFGRLAALILSAADVEAADFTARALARAAPQLPGVAVLGPAPAPLAILRGRHRRRFLVKADRGTNLQTALLDWIGRVRVTGSVRVQADIDPYSFL